ncbi:tRNA (N6-threonylcarbamoyladenosine(37)-N6)-methyltransferase TrmO [Acinetobacter sp. MD2(2019)]|uniref:tRNA (N6-threonylcarbamoyladenosine(37)-N6)-methyltransferase TrmO n=1 Tax=Acinetobacter sp. MD2(2019) TaxID=2605273 RepID=UPI002D1F936E|nr:tRNA (N6-threonylcarbamoyladenosine(37)-N6)-methyltransferase TrmO [Acinetobacter sp. MD2(2019)]MEB3754109.1 tRNA (N6-threonylcarbamoyladenosine(37)-N6)-methyltransferase TrmO [Acinetobacter sp. MD2(2019)]
MMNDSISIPIVGVMRSPYKEKFGIPRQPNLVEVESYIEMQPPYDTEHAFEGLNAFSHIWLLWQFHQNKAQDKQAFRAQVRPPRLGGNEKIGVFATRSMYRPAPIGLSVVKLKRIVREQGQLRVYVVGSDLLDATPIVDIKPYIAYSDAILDAQSSYAAQAPVLKTVHWQAQALAQQHEFLAQNLLSQQRLNELEQILALDPRPAYQNDPERRYGLRFGEFNIHFFVQESDILISEIQLEQRGI